MTRIVRLWTIGGLIFGIIVGLIIGWMVGENTMVGWVVISAIGGTLFWGLWGYANEQSRKVRRPDLFK